MRNLEKQLVQRYPLLGSSQSPEEISLSIKGAVVVLLPFLALVLGKFGLNQEALAEIVNGVFGMVGSVLVLVGLWRKFKK